MAGTLIHGSTTLHYIDELEVTCALNAADIAIDRAVIDARTFCGNSQVPGNRDVMASFGGFGLFGADDYEEELAARMQSGADVNRLTVFGNAVGARTYEVLGPLGKASHAWKAAEILGLSGEIPKGQSLSRGILLNVAQTVTGTGALTGQEHEVTAATTQTFVATIRVKSVSGAGSVTFVVQESQDDGAGDAYANIAGPLSATFTGVGIQRLTTTGATELWKRINVSAFSGFTNVVATVTVAVQMPA